MDQKETERKERLKEIKEKTAKTAEFRREKLLEDAKARENLELDKIKKQKDEISRQKELDLQKKQDRLQDQK